jgi:hypothetical protein
MLPKSTYTPVELAYLTKMMPKPEEIKKEIRDRLRIEHARDKYKLYLSEQQQRL